jgi:putative ABC transport system permease protein
MAWGLGSCGILKLFPMFKNYLAVAFRNLRRNKIFSVINILGLSIGISASLVIFLIVQYSNGFDRFEKNPDRIFRVVSDFAFQGDPGHSRGVAAPLGDAISKEISGIENLVSFRYYSPEKLSVIQPSPSKPTLFKEPKHIIFADAHYFDLLPYQWIAGNKKSAIEQEGQVVLSESRAKLYFPTKSFADIIGQKIVYDDSLSAQVSGIVADLDKQGNTDFNFSEFISLNSILKNTRLRNSMYWDQWGSTTSDQQLYLQLASGSTKASVEKRLKAIFDKNLGENAKKNNYTWAYNLQPLGEIHFNSDYGTFDSPIASKPVLLGLILVAVFLILIASINFINLTTAQAAQRAKEIGVRKTLGCSKGQLIFQFLGETILVTSMATILSIVLTPTILKAFSSFIPEGVQFSVINPFVIVFLLILLVSVSLLAGFYPAWVLSSSNALEVLKNRAYAGTNKTRTSWLRKGLTVFQFVIAQFFVIGAMMVSKQIHFMLNTDLGFSKQAIVKIDYPSSDTSLNHKKYVISQLKNIKGVQLMTMASDIPSSYGWWTSSMEYGAGKNPLQTNVELKAGDNSYLDLLQIPILAGRDLMPADTAREILINETYLHLMGFKQPIEAIGKMLKWDEKKVPIVGVFRDFHAHPLNFKIAPMAFVRDAKSSHLMMASLPKDHAGWPSIIAGMKKTFLHAYPGEEFKYEFLDESLANAYDNVRHTSQLLNWAMGLTIFISCLGLLGLVIYTTTHRAKEISIRKVLGASVTQVMALLSSDFIKLVALAFLIATPLAWWAIHEWLNDFVFRTSASWWIFLACGLGMIVVALITLSVQTIHTAMANPVKNLNSE